MCQKKRQIFRKRLYRRSCGVCAGVRRKVIFGLYKLPMVKTDNRRMLLADGGYSFINSLAEDNALAKRSLAAWERKLRGRGISPKVITGHTGWSGQTQTDVYKSVEKIPILCYGRLRSETFLQTRIF